MATHLFLDGAVSINKKKNPRNVKTFSNQIKQILRPVENVFFLMDTPLLSVKGCQVLASRVVL